MLLDQMKANRTVRRYDESAPVSMEDLKYMIDAARFIPSGMNMQPLKYRPVQSEAGCAAVFETLGWAGYLKEWDGPAPGERPRAYLVVLENKAIGGMKQIDLGAAGLAVTLAARERGFACCIFQNIKREALLEALGLDPERYAIATVIAIGKPAETVLIEEIAADGDIKYFRDDADRHIVPKRRLEDIII